MPDGGRGRRPPATTTSVVGEDWYGRHLLRERHTRVAFVDVDMTELVNEGSTFEECTFAGVRLNASVHSDAAFTSCTFTRSVLFDARFERCKMVGSTFDRCTFDALVVDGGNWGFVDLARADLRSARFTGTRLREADLTGARCHGGTLRDGDLSGAALAGADLSGCDLRGTDLGGIDPLGVDLRRALVTIEQAVVIAEALGVDVRVE